MSAAVENFSTLNVQPLLHGQIEGAPSKMAVNVAERNKRNLDFVSENPHRGAKQFPAKVKKI